jgi:DNA repair ATPase RecN
MDLALLEGRARSQRSLLDRRLGEARAVAADGKACQQAVASLEGQLEVLEKAAGVLTAVSEERQEAAQRHLEGLVTRALQVVFGEELSFHLVQSVKAGRPEVDFVLRSTYGGDVIDTPVMDARGGGTAAVVGFVLRLVVLLLTPGARRFLALDESFAHVSASYEPRVAEFLREVCDKAGVQVLLITHSTAYNDLADAKYRFSLGPDGVTVVEQDASE